MSANDTAPSGGIDLESAREKLKGLPPRRLDSDWIAVDRNGHVAFFVGNEGGPIPNEADVGRISEAVEALGRAANAWRSAGDEPAGYRRAAFQKSDPIFDPPVTMSGEPLHEPPIDGYPLLVVGTKAGLRDKLVAWNGREVATRDALGVVFPSLESAHHQELHWTDLCEGCRAVDDPNDPRPRAPELLAAAGLYVYVHTEEYSPNPYRRVASPSVPADLVDLEQIVQLVASRVKFDVSFEDERSLQPRDFFDCPP